METYTYATVTTLGDFGPWISKIILDLPGSVRASDVRADAFSSFCARRTHDGDIVMRTEKALPFRSPRRATSTSWMPTRAMSAATVWRKARTSPS